MTATQEPTELERTRANYHDWPELSKTQLADALAIDDERCFHDFWSYNIGKTQVRDVSGKHIDIGDIGHRVLLEDQKVVDLVGVWPDWFLDKNGDVVGSKAAKYHALIAPIAPDVVLVPYEYITEGGNLSTRKEAKAWKAAHDRDGHMVVMPDEYNALMSVIGENKRRYMLKQDELEAICSAVDAVKAHESWKWISQAVRETPITWTEQVHTDAGVHDFAFRCCPDFVLVLEDRVLAFDLKFTPNVRPSLFRKHIKRFSYWLQDSHYSMGLQQLHGLPVDYRFLCVDPGGRHAVALNHLDADSRMEAASKRMELLVELGERYIKGLDEEHWLDDWEMESNAIRLDYWEYNQK